MVRITNERGRPGTLLSMIAVVLAACMIASLVTCEVSYAELSTKKQWGKDITDAKLNKYNGKNYYWKLPGVNQFACTGYTEWALNSVYGVYVPSYASTRALREYFIKKGNKIVAYGSHVAKAQGGNGKYYMYGEIKPGDIVFFFRRKTGKNGKITKSPIGASRGYTQTSGWAHVAVIGGKVSGSHGITSKLHHNNHAYGIHYGGTIKKQITKYTAEKGATDYQVMRVIEPETVKRPVKIRKSMKVNGNVLPEEKAVFRIWPQKYGKYSSKSSWWKKIPGEYKDKVTTDKNGNAVTKKLPTASDDFNGKYYIYQTKGPGDVKLAKNKAITLKKGTSTVEWKYTDVSSEHPSIVKMDAATDESVTQEGIRFRLKKKGAFAHLQEYIASGGKTDSGSDEAETEGAGTESGEDSDGPKAENKEGSESSAEGAGTSSGEKTESGTEDAEVTSEEGTVTVPEDVAEGNIADPEDTAEDAEDSGDTADQGEEGNEKSGEDKEQAYYDAEKVVKAFLSNDPEEELKELGVDLEDSGWASIGGKNEFVTDESGEAEMTTVNKGDVGEYEVYEVSSPDGYKLPGYAIAAVDPDSASELDLPVNMTLKTVASTVTVKYNDMPDPEIGTEAVDDITGDHFGSAVRGTGITDTVYMSNLETGKAYTLTGILMFKDTGEPVEDSSGNSITSIMSFDAEESDQTILMDFSLDGRLLQGRAAVVFEKLYEGDFDDEPENMEPLAVHEDLGDEDQTVYYPDGHTSAKDHETGTHEGTAASGARIDDVFKYENLKPGTEYVLTGTLYYKATGDPVRSGGKEVTTDVVFTPEEKSGEVEVTFKLDASEMDGDEVVACEVLKTKGKTVLVHKDLNDELQTISYPDKPEEPDEPPEEDDDEPPERQYTNSPKTGDDQMELLILLITVLICAVVILTIIALTYRDKGTRKIKKKGMR